MPPKLKTLKELLAEIARLNQQVEMVKQKEKDEAIVRCRADIETYGLTHADLFAKVIPRRKVKASEKTFAAKAPAPAKRKPLYQDPETGATWTGGGSKPKWMTGDKEEYLIANQVEKPHARGTQNNKGTAHPTVQ